MITYFTSESVCKGHPDKLCDIIADTILDNSLERDPHCCSSVEVVIFEDTLFIYGESDTPVDYIDISKQVLKESGYRPDYFTLINLVREKKGLREVSKIKDQCIVFGYACNETEEYMPLSIYLAHKIAKELDDNCSHYGLLAGGKVQVTVAYEDSQKFTYISDILLSKDNNEDMQIGLVEESLRNIVKVLLGKLSLDKYILPSTSIRVISNKITSGNIKTMKGMTGRKIVVDTYGGHGRVGGGSFSSKNPTQIDRIGAYYARYIAQNVVRSGRAEKCEIQLAYTQNDKNPVSLNIECYNTNKMPMSAIYAYVLSHYDCTPESIIEELNLRSPIYKDTSCYGHFGNPNYPWEKEKFYGELGDPGREYIPYHEL